MIRKVRKLLGQFFFKCTFNDPFVQHLLKQNLSIFLHREHTTGNTVARQTSPLNHFSMLCNGWKETKCLYEREGTFNFRAHSFFCPFLSDSRTGGDHLIQSPALWLDTAHINPSNSYYTSSKCAPSRCISWQLEIMFLPYPEVCLLNCTSLNSNSSDRWIW